MQKCLLKNSFIICHHLLIVTIMRGMQSGDPSVQCSEVSPSPQIGGQSENNIFYLGFHFLSFIIKGLRKCCIMRNYLFLLLQLKLHILSIQYVKVEVESKEHCTV